MTAKIGTCIRALRKSRALTQEQLAEAIGVTGGAVYKWEAQLSVPDLDTVMALADFFETSVDALLGFELQSRNVDALLARMDGFQRENDYAGAVAEAERALQKYPNNFRVVYYCASVYEHAVIGMPMEQKKPRGQRALELLERACGLIDQNTDAGVSLLSIQNRMADVYVAVGEYERAVELLKRNNQDGRNNARIGRILAANCGRGEESLSYLSAALYGHAAALYDIVTGYANAYFLKRDAVRSMELIRWLLEAVRGLRQPGKASYFDPRDALLLLMYAEIAAEVGDWQTARESLTRARETALQFDAAPDYGMGNLKFYHGPPEAVAYGALRETAMDNLRRHLYYEDGAGQRLLPLWEALERGETL